MQVGDLVCCGKDRYGIVMEIYQSGSGWGGGRNIIMACVFTNGRTVRAPICNLRIIS